MRDPTDEFWCALAHPVRRRILDLLRNGPLTTGELVEAFPDLSRFAVMLHLDQLAEAYLVLVRRDGRKRFNYLNAVPLREMYERWVNRYADLPAAAAMELGRYLDRSGGKEKTLSEMEAGKIVKIEMEQRYQAPIERVFAALTTELDNWWAFRFKPESRVVVEPWVGGRIFEEWGDGTGALYGNIVYLDPPFKMTSRGPGGINGNFSNISAETLVEEGDVTVRKVSIRMWGEVPDDLAKMFTEGTKAIAEQLLRRYVEEGVGWRDGQ
jgi:DNA-binding transcriptional ArsR family regulator/uncharacterized protein YndB with AHSA1/START domain